MRPLVLLSNDDGYMSGGLRALRDAVALWAETVIVAPSTEQSATSHALTLHRPLRARQYEPGLFAIDGTPADCVYIALHAGDKFLPRWPDLVLSGINRGLNLGQDAFYSGTVAAAREGALRGIPAIAVSADRKSDRARVAKLASDLGKTLVEVAGHGGRRPPAIGPRTTPLFNLNVPPHFTGEVRKTRLGARLYDETIEIRNDPRGREYIWLGGPEAHHESDPGSDTDAYDDGAASVTALALDLTLTNDGGVIDSVLARLT